MTRKHANPMTETEILAHCGRAIVKIDTRGPRGVEMVTHDEITAMALLIDLTGAGHLCRHTAEAVYRLNTTEQKEITS